MTQFTICGKRHVKDTIKRVTATHVLTLLDPGDSIFLPLTIPRSHWHVEHFEDEEDEHHVFAPQRFHAQSILEWGSTLPKDASVVVHCADGKCRSTAAALALHMQAHEQVTPQEAEAWLMQQVPDAYPNILLARYLDEQMGRQGEFVKLCEHIRSASALAVMRERWS